MVRQRCFFGKIPRGRIHRFNSIRPRQGTPPTPAPRLVCCYNVVTQNARFGAFWCAIRYLDHYLAKVQNRECLWYHNARFRRITKAINLASTPSIGTMKIKISSSSSSIKANGQGRNK
jgi:hypothetical protein